MKQMELTDCGNSRVSRDERKDQIYSLLADLKKPLAAREIARVIGLKNSVHVRDILSEMCADGEIESFLAHEEGQQGILPTRFYLYHEFTK